ncbi:DUF6864 domain-containing function [Pseudomonas syringae]|uniref:Uncharacterized protein n=5 Tax=Pseudomonas syringae TaxID=317 RepID=A0A9Q4A433_PSESX|nr:hypothetical protein [Pseudomonas syringae]MCF5470353.1 hypothetical protein [Pseudomonas syringae]MCF5471549.1 hypothetical protein [Pseudomonas syringae]MCF5482156.1 hypothetical protein [Pseudomonas syringae]MCF5489546.1 hypothetical protein [Pseudomonas syringae]MCF5498558.1 hypothetical protein [Pseudomonas syringae]
MSALRVGGNEVILASSLLVPEGDSVEFDLDVGESEKFFCIFKFEREPGSTDKPSMSFEGVEGDGVERCIFTFRNFNKPTGHSIVNPIEFAEDNMGRNFYILGTVYGYKTSHRIEFQIMAGPKNEQ